MMKISSRLFLNVIKLVMVLTLLSFSISIPMVSGASPPDIDGLLDPEYGLISSVPNFGDLYLFQDASYFYIAFNVSNSRNDNIFGPLVSGGVAGWTPPHRATSLIKSDHLSIILKDCDDTTVYDFTLDYIHDADNALSPNNPDRWISGVSGADGSMDVGLAGNVLSASSLEWNFENTAIATFDFTAGNPTGTSPANYGGWLSPDAATVPTWEFSMIYEFRVARSPFTTNCLGSIIIDDMHNSPDKAGDTVTTSQSITTSIVTTISTTEPQTSTSDGTTTIGTTDGTTTIGTTEFQRGGPRGYSIGGVMTSINKFAVLGPYLLVTLLIGVLLLNIIRKKAEHKS